MKVYNLVVIFFLIAVITITAHADEVMPSEVKIKAMVVEVSSGELRKVGLEDRMENLSQEEILNLKNKLESNEIEVKILYPPTIITIDSTEGTTRFIKDIHYMEKVGDNLYQLKTLKNIGISFTAQPIIEDNIIHTTVNLQVSYMRERQVLSEAPDLDIGPPVITSQQISTAISVNNGETIIIGGLREIDSEKEGLNTLVFVTANIIDN